MRSSEKKLILTIIIIGVVIIGGLLIWKNGKQKETLADNNKTNEVIRQGANELEENVQKLEDGSKLNISEELRKTKTVDGLEIKNIQFKESGNITMLTADIEEKNGQERTSPIFKIEVVDKLGNIMTTMTAPVSDIPANGKAELRVGASADVANAYNINIKKIK